MFVDADNDFAKRVDEVKQIIEDRKITCGYFLFPDHANTGNIESLLETISTNKDVWDCYLQFEKCLDAKGLSQPSGKTKLYTYAEILTDKKGRKKDLHKDDARNYLNSNWNLGHNVLEALHKFLSNYLAT